MNRYIVRSSYFEGAKLIAYRDIEVYADRPIDAISIAGISCPGSFSQDVIETNGKRHAGW